MKIRSVLPHTTAVVLCLSLGALGAGCGGDNTADAQKQADKIVSDAKAKAEQIQADAKQEAETSTQAKAANTEADSSSESAGSGLPNLVGKGLQYAQDTAQAAGFYNLTSHDASGRSREQILDRNWKVCTQKPKPGTKNTDAEVDFGTVKTEESCPSSDQGAEPVKQAGATMPNFVGKSASAAEDALPNASIDFKDGTGAGRTVIIASNWQVCAQKPAAGQAYDGVPVTFTVVKYGEDC